MFWESAPALVGGFALALGLIGLGAKSLWFDEAYDAVHAQDDWSGLLSTAFGHEASQAAYLVLLKLWLYVVPDSEFWTRFPSVVATALAAGMLVWLGRVLFDRRVGLIAGVLLATSGFVVSWSQQTRTYALAMLAAVASSCLLVRALKQRTGRSWIAYAIVAAAAVYVHFFAGLVVAAHAVAAVVAKPRPATRFLCVAALIIGAAALPALWFVARKDVGQISWIAPLTPGGVKSALLRASDSNPLLLALGAVGWAILLWRPSPTVTRSGQAMVLAWASLPLAIAIALSFVKPVLTPRYLIVSVPALALLGALAVTTIRVRWLAHVLLAATLSVGLFRVLEWYRVPAVEDWRGAVRYVETNRKPGQQVLVGQFDEPYRYYAGRRSSRSEPTSSAVWLIMGAQSQADALEEARATVDRRKYRIRLERAYRRVYVIRAIRAA